MREIRLSGSVEGVVSNHDPYSDWRNPFERSQDSSLHSQEAIGKNAKVDIIFAMRIFVLAMDGVFDTGLATVLDAFETANELAEMSGQASPRFDVAIVGVRKAVKTSQGLIVPVAPAPMRIIPDWVVVPAIGFKMPGPLQAALARSDVILTSALVGANCFVCKELPFHSVTMSWVHAKS
jgi:hypothetical protein